MNTKYIVFLTILFACNHGRIDAYCNGCGSSAAAAGIGAGLGGLLVGGLIGSAAARNSDGSDARKTRRIKDLKKKNKELQRQLKEQKKSDRKKKKTPKNNRYPETQMEVEGK